MSEVRSEVDLRLLIRQEAADAASDTARIIEPGQVACLVDQLQPSVVR